MITGSGLSGLPSGFKASLGKSVRRYLKIRRRKRKVTRIYLRGRISILPCAKL